MLLDCLTLWVSNLLLSNTDGEQPRPDISAEAHHLLQLYEQGDASWIVVSNEVGLGVIPSNELARAYADELGRVNRIFAEAADDVILMVAGVPVNLKAPETGEARS